MKVEERLAATEIFEPGRRTRRGRRRRRRGRALSLVLAVALVGGGGWAGTRWIASRDGATDGVRSFGAGKGAQTAFLFMIRRAEDLSRRSDMMVVFALNEGGRDPVTLFIPTGALTEIPGHGLDFAGRGFSFGGMPLQSLVVDNILGIKLDQDVAFSDAVMAKMIDDAGGLDIDVPGELLSEKDGQVIAEFAKGTQRLDGEGVRRYLRFQAADETELSRLARAQQVWEALILRWGRMGPGVLAQKFRGLGKQYGQGLETGLQPLELAEFFTSFAAAGADSRVYTTLPVTPVGAGGDEQALKINEEAVAEIAREYFRGSVPRGAHVGTRVEVLNGSGIPQVGVDIGLKLIPAGFRIVLNRNARSFDQQSTLIRVYSRDEQAMATARKIHALMGVGEIQISLLTQTLVDVTVVVGHDFKPRDR